MSHLTLTDAVADYARQVRSHLADLGPEMVDDLTDGLEADLAEALADTDAASPLVASVAPQPVAPTTFVADPAHVSDAGPAQRADSLALDVVARFGSPSDYAAELRVAAGVAPSPPAVSRRGRGTWAGSTARARAVAARAAGPVTRAPWWPEARDFLVAMRPVWWILRGWLVGVLVLTIVTDGHGYFDYRNSGSPELGALAPAGLAEFLVMSVFVVVSVQYGRGRWTPRGRWNAVGVIASVGAAVAVVPAVITVMASIGDVEVRYEYVDNTDYSVTTASVGGDRNALIAGGERVRNLFVYGPDGEYVEGAQIVDQDGRPLLLTPEGSMWEEDDLTGEELSSFWVPREDVNGRQVWNAYPLGYWTNHMGEWDEAAQNWFLPAGFDPWPRTPAIARVTPLRPAQSAPAPGTQTPAPTDAPTDGTAPDGGTDGRAPGSTGPDDGTDPDGTTPDGTVPDDDTPPSDGKTPGSDETKEAPSDGKTTKPSDGETKKASGGTRLVPDQPTRPVRSGPQGSASAR